MKTSSFASRLGLPSRRRVLAGFAALGSLLLPLRSHAAARATPSMTEGPFYPERFTAAPLTQLVRGAIPRGERLRLEGRVADLDGRPIAGARVEIWQCDPTGRYHHSRDSRPEQRDPDFAGFGWTTTDAQGRYGFDTIRPVPYTGRTPHIHIAVIAAGRARLVTQIFVDGDPGNASDFLYRMLSPQARAQLAIRIAPGDPVPTGRFDVTLG